MVEYKKDSKRREFLRHAAISSIVLSAGGLFVKAYLKGEDCIGSGKCKACMSNKKCDLDLAKEYRAKLRDFHG
jgi:hypothetical protein